MSIVDEITPFFGDNSGALGDEAGTERGIAAEFEPWQKAGYGAFTDALSRYKQLLDNPDFLENQEAKNYKTSDYATGQLKNITNAMNSAAAVSGSLGSGYQGANLSDHLQQLINGDENQYIDRATNQYNAGLQGEQAGAGMGLSALNSEAGFQSQAAQDEAAASASHQDAINKMIGGGLGLAGDFFTGGKGGFGTLMGQWGKSAGFGGGNDGMDNQSIMEAIQTLRNAGIM